MEDVMLEATNILSTLSFSPMPWMLERRRQASISIIMRRDKDKKVVEILEKGKIQ